VIAQPSFAFDGSDYVQFDKFVGHSLASFRFVDAATSCGFRQPARRQWFLSAGRRSRYCERLSKLGGAQGAMVAAAQGL